MSWAMRRRVLYLTGLFLFFIIVVGLPLAYKFSTVPASCVDGQQNQEETTPDKGGPCPNVDTNLLAPSSVVWTRSFKVRDGSYSVVSYIQNPNDHAGIGNIAYTFSLYDSENVLVAERKGEMFVMPGGITPVYEPDIDTGNRIVQRAFFRFDEKGQWRNYEDTSKVLRITDRELSDITTVPRLQATVTNIDTLPRTNISFVAVILDTAGNAFASSATKIDRIEAGQTKQIVFTWPNPFALQVGRIDILPVTVPKEAWSAPCTVVSDTVTCKE